MLKLNLLQFVILISKDWSMFYFLVFNSGNAFSFTLDLDLDLESRSRNEGN